MSKHNNVPSTNAAAGVGSSASEQEYKIGPGRPPKECRFKKGQSGNPKGAKRKQPSMAPDLKAALEAALTKPVNIKQGDVEWTVDRATAGIEQLVAQYVKGDRHARRDLMALADRLGVDLIAGESKAMQEALAINHQAILDAYVARKTGKISGSVARRDATKIHSSKATAAYSKSPSKVSAISAENDSSESSDADADKSWDCN